MLISTDEWSELTAEAILLELGLEDFEPRYSWSVKVGEPTRLTSPSHPGIAAGCQQ
jgi:hypothetical protein